MQAHARSRSIARSFPSKKKDIAEPEGKREEILRDASVVMSSDPAAALSTTEIKALDSALVLLRFRLIGIAHYFKFFRLTEYLLIRRRWFPGKTGKELESR